jgi:hypothetical protein
MTKIPVSISQLAKYGLDYVSLISSSASRSRPVKTEQMDADLLSIPDLIFKSEVDSITIDLVTSLDKQFDPTLPNKVTNNVRRSGMLNVTEIFWIRFRR